MLTFSKGGAPVKKTASIREVIKESSEFALRGSKVRSDFELVDDLWPLEIDTGQISQVIQNLIINADHAMPNGGVVQVRAENTLVGDGHELPLQPGKYVKVSIKDQGIGIPNEHQAKIFDPYFTTKQKGSGLGLAIAYSIVKGHDGCITLDSRLGRGTTFFIYLPASENEIPRPMEREECPLSGEGKILLMDDEENVRRVAGRMLVHMGYSVEYARDGSEAVRLYKEAMDTGEPFNAVIMDLTVQGGKGGKEAIKELVEIDSEVKAIVASGYSNDPVMSNCKDYFFQGVVTKPFNMEELGEALQMVVS